MKRDRKSGIKRKTKETDISLKLNLDGSGRAGIKIPLGFLGHMLELFARHGNFDLTLSAVGDTHVDSHHTNEDIGICLGLAIKEALGEKAGIRRFGFASVPMDEALVEASLDLSGRPYVRVTGYGLRGGGKEGGYTLNDLKQLLQGVVNNAGITLHVEIISGDDLHHIIEAVFKALGRALKEAVSLDPRIKGILSTKGRL